MDGYGAAGFGRLERRYKTVVRGVVANPEPDDFVTTEQALFDHAHRAITEADSDAVHALLFLHAFEVEPRMEWVL